MKPIELALSLYGIKEIKGEIDNSDIIEMFIVSGFEKENFHDETSWCSAFVNYCQILCGHEASYKLDARSWLSIGQKTDYPKLGDIAVLWRGKSKDELITGSNIKKGHVGYYIKSTKKYIWILGGNQDNQVKVKVYAKSRLLNYIRT